MNLRLHAFETGSRANGPGLRAVVWMQGCSLGCAGCFNPETHDPNGGREMDTQTLAEEIAALHDIDGVSISGGEPFQQPDALYELLERLRQTRLSILVFSGYSLHRIRTLPLGPAILDRIHVLIAGPYVAAKHLGRGLLGSTNQRIHLLTTRHRLEDFDSLPRREVILHKDGTVTFSGVEPLRIKAALP